MGVGSAFISALGFSLMFIFTRKGMLKDNAKSNIWLVSLISVIGALILFGVVAAGFDIDIRSELQAISSQAFLLLVGDGLFGSFLGTIFGVAAIAKLGISHASAIRAGVNPLFVTLLAILLLGETSGIIGLTGVITIITGITLVSLNSSESIVQLDIRSNINGGMFAVLSGFSFALANICRGAAIQLGAPLNASYTITMISGLLVFLTVFIFKGFWIELRQMLISKVIFYYLTAGFGLFTGVYFLLIAFYIYSCLAGRFDQKHTTHISSASDVYDS